MSKKTKQTNTPGWSAPPATQATTNLQSMVDTPVDYATPIRNSYARAEQSLNKSYQNPLGAYTTADVKDKAMRSQRKDLFQSMGLDLSNAAQQSAADKFGRQATVAGFTRPQMYNASSTQSSNFGLGDALGLGTSLGTGYLTGKAGRK